MLMPRTQTILANSDQPPTTPSPSLEVPSYIDPKHNPSLEAEFFAAVSASKAILYIRSLLRELGHPPTAPTPVYKDNEACIKVINSRHPTERTRHIDKPAFRVPYWKQRGDLCFHHIKNILNPADANSKPLGWVLHSRHSLRMMGYYYTSSS